jgi:hypothetical protein
MRQCNAAGEEAESRKKGVISVDAETGNGDPADIAERMEMAEPRAVGTLHEAVRRVMRKAEWGFQVGIGQGGDPPLLGDRVDTAVVIAANQGELDLSEMLVAERGDEVDEIGRETCWVVEEISHDQDAASGATGGGEREASEVAFDDAHGNGHARGTKRFTLAEMEIGDDERAARGPEGGTLGEEVDALAGNFEAEGSGVGAQTHG